MKVFLMPRGACKQIVLTRAYNFKCSFSPAIHHNLIHCSGTARRRRESISGINEIYSLYRKLNNVSYQLHLYIPTHISTYIPTHISTSLHTSLHLYISTWFVFPSNGLCPRLHISYMSAPKLHTSLAVEYFLLIFM